MENKKIIIVIAAMTPSRAIGSHGSLPWHIPEDLARFKALTTGHTIIMGRKTFDSLPHGALPNRRNIVLSRTVQTIPGCEVFRSLTDALSSCADEDEVFVIGGASVYEQALPLASRLCLTMVNESYEPSDADTFFPRWNPDEWRETKREEHHFGTFLEMIRISSDTDRNNFQENLGNE